MVSRDVRHRIKRYQNEELAFEKGNQNKCTQNFNNKIKKQIEKVKEHCFKKISDQNKKLRNKNWKLAKNYAVNILLLFLYLAICLFLKFLKCKVSTYY